MSPRNDPRAGPGPVEPPAPHQNPSMFTTFGIELECVLAFHELELRRVLEENEIEAEIKKDLLRIEHAALLGTALLGDRRGPRRRSHFPSWALYVPANDQTKKIAGFRVYGRLRPYFIEPLLIAQNVLESAQCTTNVIGHNAPGSPIIHVTPQFNAIFLRKSEMDYNHWNLTYDLSVPGATSAELYQNVPHKINEQNRHEWDSWGIELVSRVFAYARRNDAFEEVHRYLSALKGDQSRTTAAFGSVWAGTHVHLGIDVQDRTDISHPKTMRVLQHLAYILVSNEHLITQFHPVHRSGDRPEHDPSYPMSPRAEDEDDPVEDEDDPVEDEDDPVEDEDDPVEDEDDPEENEDDPVENEDDPEGDEGDPEEDEDDPEHAERSVRAAVAAHVSSGDLASNARILALVAQRAKVAGKVSWSDMRNTLFREKLEIEQFVNMLQGTRRGLGNSPHRGYFVNWFNLVSYQLDEPSDKGIKPTIEFRQHACTLDTDELRHWVDLLFAMMRVAEAKAEQTTQFISGDALDPAATFAEREGSKYRINDQWRRNTVEDFCGPDLLDLDAAEIEYWKGRYALHKRDLEDPPWA